MTAIAEGVETNDQLEHLKTLNCDFGQGYHFARPLKPEDATGLLKAGLRSSNTRPGRPGIVQRVAQKWVGR